MKHKSAQSSEKYYKIFTAVQSEEVGSRNPNDIQKNLKPCPTGFRTSGRSASRRILRADQANDGEDERPETHKAKANDKRNGFTRSRH